MFRRSLASVLGAALIATLSMSSALAAASPEGVLRASFDAYWSGGEGASSATFLRGGQGWFHAASSAIDLEQGAVRIGLAPVQEYCSSNVFGIWALVADPDKAALAGSTYEMAFGPAAAPLAPLAFERSALKRAVDPQGVWWGGDPWWWQSVGVPVYGTLAPGEYSFHVVIDSAYGTEVFNPAISIVSC